MSDPTIIASGGRKAPPPKRRRRGVRMFDSIFDCTTDMLFEPLFWIGKGKNRRKVSAEYFMLRWQFKDAMEGQEAAMKAMLKVIEANQKVREGEQEYYETFVPQGYDDPRNANAALLILGLASVRRSELRYVPSVKKKGRPYSWELVIEPDLVAAALGRPEAPQLSRKQADAVRGHTRDAASPPVTEVELEGAPLYDSGVLPRDPRETRFKPGYSGNPKGRPPKSKVQLPFEDFLNELIVVPFGDSKRQMPRLDALFLEMVKRGVQRDNRIEQRLFDLLIKERKRRFKPRQKRPSQIMETRI